MFSRKYSPEDIADQLFRVVMPSGAMYVAAYYKFVHPNEEERVRIVFSLLLLPLALSYPMVQTTTNSKLREAILQSHDVYLGRIQEADQLVDLGRYIVWGVEREAIARELRERSCELILPSTFDGRRVRYGMLVRVTADVRNRTYFTDFNFGRSQSGGDPKLGVTLAFAALATSFTKRVFTQNPCNLGPDAQNPTLTQSERFQKSIALASAFHAHGFFAVADLFKRLG